MPIGFETFGRTVRRAALACLALSAVAGLARAQAPAQDPMKKPYKALVSINPLGLPFEYVSAETESRITGLVTSGASLSYLNLDDASYLSVEAKLRFYPNEEAFKGFSIGIAGGFSRLSEDFTSSNGDKNTATRPTIAVLADYNWLLGKNKRMLVGTGVGAKRIFGDDNGFSDVNFAYPTVRFQIGVLF